MDNDLTFIPNQAPPLPAGIYTIEAEQLVTHTKGQPPEQFKAQRSVAVAGARFALSGDDVISEFPQHLANGEFSGALPHAVLRKCTLPWERQSVKDKDSTAPWLAILTLDQAALGSDPLPAQRTVKVKEVLRATTTIAVADSNLNATGTLAPGLLSYPDLKELQHGERPDDQTNVIDLPIAIFNKVAPSAADLPFLAHIREAGTTHGDDLDTDTVKYAVVIGNRVVRPNTTTHAYLVSVESLGPYLPAADGTPSPSIPTGTTLVRLIVYRTWQFFANDLRETLEGLLKNVNKTGGQDGLSSLRLPALATPPTHDQVEQALKNQANGALAGDDAKVLVANALAMGYVPMAHQLRQAGQTVSWYRGPLVPMAIEEEFVTVVRGPDQLLRYNPQTGMFDLAYAAAWQLGQLLALQSRRFAMTLSGWKAQCRQKAAALREHEELLAMVDDLTTMPFSALFERRRERLLAASGDQVPGEVIDWLGALELLYGVPFGYLVPDERMLPAESLRFFHVDPNWIKALLDGAGSIGRISEADYQRDCQLANHLQESIKEAALNLRRNPRPMSLAHNANGRKTGCLLRSQAVAGWPRLNVIGYADTAGTAELGIVRQSRVARDVLLCLFNGEVKMAAVQQPAEQLHCGARPDYNGNLTTTLRAVTGDDRGRELGVFVGLPRRGDQPTLRVAEAAAEIKKRLNPSGPEPITSAELALQLVRGAVRVEFQLSA